MREIAALATRINGTSENIGARRLQSVGAACDQAEGGATRGELTNDCAADAGGGSRNDNDLALLRHEAPHPQ